MKALTLSQPWATLVAIGAKRIETRGYRYNGPLAIHAAKGFPKSARAFTAQPIVYEAVKARYCQRDIEMRASGFPAYPLGCVIATCNVVECLPVESTGCLSGVFDDYPELDTPQERAFGNYAPGRWGWVLEDVLMLPIPIPAKGALSLWEWNP
jgi:activating signal cointegrator 1